MKRAATSTLAALALVSAVFVAGADGHKARFDTTVTAKFNKPQKNDPYPVANFDGAVSSTKLRCEKNRSVDLLLRASDGSTTVVGSDLTDASGAWVIQPSSVSPGTYFAETAKKVLRRDKKHRHVCKPGVSRDLTVK